MSDKLNDAVGARAAAILRLFTPQLIHTLAKHHGASFGDLNVNFQLLEHDRKVELANYGYAKFVKRNSRQLKRLSRYSTDLVPEYEFRVEPHIIDLVNLAHAAVNKLRPQLSVDDLARIMSNR